jgi:hypothetical protein
MAGAATLETAFLAYRFILATARYQDKSVASRPYYLFR